jgi:hypothetical protein
LITKIDNIQGLTKSIREKNWVMFSNNNILYYIKHVDPHIILKVNLDNGQIEHAYTTQLKNISSYLNISDSSILRLNTSPIEIDEGYLSTGHFRSTHDEYFNFFYLFEKNPPFKIIKMCQPDFIGPQYS